ncbi:MULTISPECIES: histidine kinase [Sphingobacterium]|uniref:Two-component system sensory protein n=1 Tax=Sphingobacterium cellulitidis TaxID=1768011 RepID=A0A8H9KUC7_9SPHI|nr:MULTISPECIES: histidine kinase [Sphingobacterium]MBA8986635.1 two-component system sensor histidine kinase KdpD [Sphingobacterium soli]OYD41012.1 histidine kinase [Sphingobacterium cellulitidis]OYD44399.1 histidine kinase [Sphingobacterium cellulitidis]WFB65187.1 sensor protein KdpD [Sphingobacterium sp. WM]GGE27726.1 two-component system sensory protein [Sphingobacterium soli]
MEEQRKSAEHFLELIKQSRRGKFKIYLGMCAGVGKTYRMLQESHNLLRNGIDVQIAYVETHNREETLALLAGLPLLPRKKIYYKGNELEDLDVDLVLQNHPEVVVVDELAHTNVPGSKNEKRWQDVMELLDAGINVISAVNIQHLEGLQAEVGDLLSVPVYERIPDRVIQSADEIVFVDISVEDLLGRLKEGKIYSKDKIDTALKNFFQSEQLLLLRELALKEVAVHAIKKHEKEKKPDSKRKAERFMVCVGSDEKKAKNLIRRTARLANFYQADWFVLYIQTPKESTNKIPLDKQRYLINNFKLATELGGQVIQVQGKDVPANIVDQVLRMEITTLCIGRPYWPFLRILWSMGIFRRLLKKLEKIQVDLIILS